MKKGVHKEIDELDDEDKFKNFNLSPDSTDTMSDFTDK